MPSEFQFDVCLSHSAKDKAVVPPLAERLRVAVRKRLKVGFDERELPVASVCDRRGEGRRSQSAATAAKIEEGLEHSRAVPLAHRMGEGGRRPGEGCMSAHAFGSDWVQLLAASRPSTFNYQPDCAPLNQERRFIPLRLGDAPIKGSLAQILYINRRPADNEHQFPHLFWTSRRSRTL